MELTTKPAYKQTEVGLIPEEWKLVNVGSLTNTSAGGTPSTKVPSYWGGNIPWMNSGELNLKQVYDVENRITEEGLVNSSTKFIPKHSILIGLAGQGKTRGTAALNHIRLCTNQSIAAIYPSKKYDSFFLYYFIDSQYDELRKLSTGDGGRGGLNLSIIKSIYVPLPPNLTEQKAIATALSDVDALIASLEQTITKKKAIKQGAMQQLLTPPHKGGKRLPEFSGEWVEKKLGGVSHIKTGSRNNQDKVADGEYPFYVRSQSVKRIDSYSYDEEAILIPGEGGIGTIFHYVNGKFEVHQRVYKISSFSEGALGKFIFFKMRHEFFAHAMTNSVKATVDSLRLPTFQEFEIYLPPTLTEQKAIAQILSDMDADITQLERKKGKHQAIKQGMMQELLTGKTRLV